MRTKKIIFVLFILSILVSSFIFQSIFNKSYAYQETDKLSNIFVVIANGTDDPGLKGYQITGMLMFYKFFRDLGINDDHIELLLYHPSYPYFIHTDCYNRYKGKYKKYIYHNEEEVEIDEEKVTMGKFLKAIKNLNSTENDYVYVYFSSHGSIKGKVVFQNEEYLTVGKLFKALKKIKYEKLFVFQETCYASRLVNGLTKLKNCIAIASCSKYRQGHAGSLATYLIPMIDKNPKLSINRIIKMTNDERIKMCYPPFIAYYSDEKLGDEPFLPDCYIQKFPLYRPDPIFKRVEKHP